MKKSFPEIKILLASCAEWHRAESHKWKASGNYKKQNNLGPPQSKELEKQHYEWAIACEEAAHFF